MMNVRDQTRQAFVACFCPFRYSTSKLVHRPQNIKSPNTSQIQTFQNHLWVHCREFSYRIILFFFKLMVIHPWRCDCLILVEWFYPQVRNIFPHVSLRDLTRYRTKNISFRHQMSLKLWQVVFPWPQQESWIRSDLCSLLQYRHPSYTLFECISKYTWSRNDVGSPRSTSFMRIVQVGSTFSVLPASLISSTYTDRNSPLARLTSKRCHLKKRFPNRFPTELSQIAFPIIVLPQDDRTDSFREKRLGLPHWTMIWAICVFGTRILIPGHSDFGNFQWRWCIFHLDLGVSGYGICWLSWTSWKPWYNVHDYCGCHLRCWWSLFSEYCIRSWNIFHNVTSEYNPAFVLLKLWFQLRILNMTWIHQWRKMCCSLLTLC